MSSFGKRLDGDPKSAVFWLSDPKVTQNGLCPIFISCLKIRKTPVFVVNTGYFYGCGGRTRTYDLRVMSPKNGFLHRFILFKKSLYRNGFSDLSFYPVVCNNSTFYSVVEFLLNLNQHPKGKEKPPSYCRTAFPKGEHMSCADCAK